MIRYVHIWRGSVGISLCGKFKNRLLRALEDNSEICWACSRVSSHYNFRKPKIGTGAYRYSMEKSPFCAPVLKKRPSLFRFLREFLRGY
jgi:hypothetical protein